MPKLVLRKGLTTYAGAVRAAAPGWDVVFTSNKEDAQSHLLDAEILVGAPPQAVEQALSGGVLRWVQTWGAGVEKYPLEALARRGVYLTNTSGVHAKNISETIFAMLLAFARGLPEAFADKQAKRWNTDAKLSEMHGRTMGILGIGSIGAETARLAKAFDMTVIGMKTTPAPIANVDTVVTPDTVDALLAESDYVVNILPHTPATRHFMNAERFARMRPTATYISVGRGETTDQDALIAALTEGGIARAGLDVFSPEPLPGDSPLWTLPNVIVTPHSAGTTPHYTERAMDVFMENLVAYLAEGKPSRNLVDLDKGY